MDPNVELYQLPTLGQVKLTELSAAPLVSVLIPNFNYGAFLGEALDSLLAQTYENWEAIVCDDGSTDNSRELLERYHARDGRIRYVLQENAGVSAALNSCFSHSTGEICCFLDSDDLFHPTKLERVVKAFNQRPNAGMCIHPIQQFDGSKEIGRPQPVEIADGWLAPTALRDGGYDPRIPPASGLSFRRQILSMAFPLPCRLRRLLDFYIAGICIMTTEVAGLPLALTSFRVHGSNISGNPQEGAAFLERYLSDQSTAVKVRCEHMRELFGSWPEMRIEDSQASRNCALHFYLMEGKMPSSLQLTVSGLICNEPKILLRVAWRSILILPSGLRKKMRNVIRGVNSFRKRILSPAERRSKACTETQ